MKMNKFIVVACLVAALVVVFIPRSRAAQTFQAPKPKIIMDASMVQFMQCINASNLTLSQKDLSRLNIVSDVLKDPYCCEKEAISEERRSCLDENIATLEYMRGMLHKIHSDKNSKCYNMPSDALPDTCGSIFSPTPGLSGDIYRDASCVKRLISEVAGKYDVLTKCPGN